MCTSNACTLTALSHRHIVLATCPQFYASALPENKMSGTLYRRRNNGVVSMVEFQQNCIYSNLYIYVANYIASNKISVVCTNLVNPFMKAMISVCV